MARARQTAQAEIDDGEDSRVTEIPRARSKSERPSWRSRLRVWVLAAGMLTAAGVAIFGVYRIDNFLASGAQFVLPGTLDVHPNLTVEGTVYARPADVARVFAADFGRSVYLMPLSARRRAVLAVDWVRDAGVSRRWPNRIAVRIAERVPVAFAVMPAAGAAEPANFETALIDADGVLLALPPKAHFSLPVLLGIRREFSPQLRRERVRQVMELVAEVKAYAGQISEIDASDPDNLKVTESVDGHAVHLMMGSRDYLAKLKNFQKNYPEISRRLPAARTFDLRLEDRITALDGVKDAK
jgi:cell division protein FtsQ